MDLYTQVLKENDPNRTLFIVPRGIAISQCRRELASRLGYIFGLRFTTFRGLIEHLGFHLSEREKTIPDLVAQEILCHLAQKISSPDVGFDLSALVQTPRGQAAALRTYRELTQAGVNPELLGNFGSKKLRLLSRLYGGYEEYCRDYNLIDPAKKALRVIDKAAAGELDLRSIDTLVVSRFAFLPHIHIRLLKALSANKKLILHLPTDGGRTDLFRDNEELLAQAEEWSRLPDRNVSIVPFEPFSGQGLLKTLQKSLFAPLAEPLDYDPIIINFSTSPRRYDEVETAVQRILELIGKGVPLGSIGITMRNIGAYDQFIHDVFDRHKIPFTYRRGVPILQSPPARIAMKLTEIGQGPKLHFDELLGTICSSFIDIKFREELRRAVLSARIYSDSPERWAERIESAMSKQPEETNTPEPEKAVEQLQFLIHDCTRLWKTESPISELRKLVERTITNIEEAEAERNYLNQQGLLRFHQLLEELDAEIVDLKELKLKPTLHPIERLRELLREESIGLSSTAADAVKVFNFYDMGYVKVDHLFILGMDEGTVPAPAYLNNLLLNDPDIEQLRRAGCDQHKMLRNTRQQINMEAQAFLLALGSARKEIRFSYPIVNEEGRETTPSPYLAEISRLLGITDSQPVIIPSADLRTIPEIPPYPLALRRQVARRLFRSDLPELDDFALPTYNALLGRDGERKFLERLIRINGIEICRRKALFSTPEKRRKVSDRYCGKIENERLQMDIRRRLEPETFSWSATSLECYGQCPFHFFLQYCLNLKELEPPAEEPTFKEEGRIMHRILKEFVEANAPYYPLQNHADAQASMESIINSYFKRLFPEIELDDYPWPSRLLRWRIEHVMRRFVASEIDVQDRRPIETEKKFGKVGEECIIAMPGGDIRFEGQIDRIDEFLQGDKKYLLIDYKRSGKPIRYYDAVFGHQLQLPIYIIAAEKLLKKSSREINAAFIGLTDNKNTFLEPLEQVNNRNRFCDWPFFFGLSPTPIKPIMENLPESKRLLEVIEEIVTQALEAYFPIEGRNGAAVPDLANLVGRWLEIPPEMESSAASE